MRRFIRRAALAALVGVSGWIPGVQAQYLPVPSPRTGAEQATLAQVEVVWASNPITSGSALKASIQRNILEVHGEVANESVRQVALSLARKCCQLPVADHLMIKPFAVQQSTPGVMVPQAEPMRMMAAPVVMGPATTLPTYHVTVKPPAPVVTEGPTLAPTVQQTYKPTAAPAPVVIVPVNTPRRVPQPTRQAAAPAPVVTGMMVTTPSYQLTSGMAVVSPPPLAQPIPLIPTPPPVVRTTIPVQAAPTQPAAVQPEEMLLLQVPPVPGQFRQVVRTGSVTPTGTAPASFASVGSTQPARVVQEAHPTTPQPTAPGQPRPRRSTDFASLRGQPTESTLVSLPELDSPSAAPVQPATTALPMLAGMRTEVVPTAATRPTTQTTSSAPVAGLNVAALQARFEAVCRPYGREVTVSLGDNEMFTVKIVVVNKAAEERITPGLLGMPELSSGKIKLEIYTLQ